MSLSAFLSDNVEKVQPKEVIISNRFKDENGKIVPWKIVPITTEQDEELRKQAFSVEYDKNGKPKVKTDESNYMLSFLTAHVVYPDLHNAQLQDSYGVKTPEELLKKMLYATERLNLEEEIKKISDGLSFEELEDEAKNA